MKASVLHERLTDFLENVADFLDNYADADCEGDPPQYRPNRAMSLMSEANFLAERLEAIQTID